MRFIVADYESFYDTKHYSVKTLGTEAYVRDARFEAHGCAIKWDADKPAVWFNRHQLKDVFARIDWSDVFLIHHHAQFDGLINSHHYNVHPKMYGCTLSMARLLIGNHLSVSLEAVRKHFGMPGKNTPYEMFNGRHWDELSPAVQQQVGAGACDEVESVWVIFQRLMADGFPVEELEVVDQTVKMFTEPVLQADSELLAQVWEREASQKSQRMAELNVTEADLQSADRFAQLLRDEGVEPETKDGKKGPIYAFAKPDQFMRDLQEDDNERVRTLAEARLGAKSTLMQTRAETLGWMASRGPMPVYLRYCGAHTTRWSGGDGANWQNFKRGSDIRKAIMAPEGYLLAPIDLSQIECRLLNYLAGQHDVVEKFRNGEDPYIGIASQAYGFPVTKMHSTERGTGKQLELSCGYQSGAHTIQNTARLGIYGPPVVISLETATQWRDLYRNTHPYVVEYWKTAGRIISRIAGGDPLEWGPMLVKDKKIFGPGGTFLNYTTLEFHQPSEQEIAEGQRDGYWRIRTRHGWSKLYSGRLVENVVQWLARIVMSQAMIRIARLGYRIVNTTHDELLVLIKIDGNQQHHLEICMAEMKRTPTWLPGLPLDCEGSLGERYSK